MSLYMLLLHFQIVFYSNVTNGTFYSGSARGGERKRISAPRERSPKTGKRYPPKSWTSEARRFAFWTTLDTAMSVPSNIILGASVRDSKVLRDTVIGKSREVRKMSEKRRRNIMFWIRLKRWNCLHFYTDVHLLIQCGGMFGAIGIRCIGRDLWHDQKSVVACNSDRAPHIGSELWFSWLTSEVCWLNKGGSRSDDKSEDEKNTSHFDLLTLSCVMAMEGLSFRDTRRVPFLFHVSGASWRFSYVVFNVKPRSPYPQLKNFNVLLEQADRCSRVFSKLLISLIFSL